MCSTPKTVFVTGGTGYIGLRLIPLLLERGHRVKALARRTSLSELPTGCAYVVGDPLDQASFVDQIPPADTFVQLVGVAHPSPAKAAEFKRVDLVSGLSSIEAAVKAGIPHFVYASVAHPAPIMRAYIAVRVACEERIRELSLHATIMRPWYVVGPGHWWPSLLRPFYAVAECIPATRESTLRLGLVTLQEMLGALVWSVEHPPNGIRVLGVEQIRQPAQR